MVEHCNYGDLKSEMIRDHHIVSILNKFLFKRLKLNLDLTLEKAKKMVCHCEAVQEQQQVLSGDVVSSLNKVQPSHPGSKKAQGESRKHNQVAKKQNQSSLKNCSRCGKKPHLKQNVLLKKLCVDASNAKDTIVPNVCKTRGNLSPRGEQPRFSISEHSGRQYRHVLDDSN